MKCTQNGDNTFERTIRLSEYVWANFVCILLSELLAIFTIRLSKLIFTQKVLCDQTRLLNSTVKILFNTIFSVNGSVFSGHILVMIL